MTLALLPKVVLHDHLDGGLRPGTLLDLADRIGYRDLPASDPDGLAAALYQGESRSLDRYLGAFRHTVAVMQTPEALTRIAAEAVEDLAADGVVYAEIRFAPSLHLAGGMHRDAAIEAVVAGVDMGAARAGIDAGVIVVAMRQEQDAAEVAAAAVRWAGRGVVGFDLAGPEEGHPASRHAEGCRVALRGGLGLTIHAGEAAGPESVADALDTGAERLGHGVRIVEDLVATPDGVEPGPVARRVLEARIPLEVCPTSNVHTRAAPSLAEHPLGALHRAGFAVTLNTDNRLMSAVTVTGEWRAAVEHHGFTLDDLRRVTEQAARAAFCDDATRARVLGRIAAGFRR